MTARSKIPVPVIAVVSEELARAFTHSKIDTVFQLADAPGAPPAGNKVDKCSTWLQLVNHDPRLDPLVVLGVVLEEYMEAEPSWDGDARLAGRDRIMKGLAKQGLSYERGGRVVAGGRVAAPTRTLEVMLRERDLASVDREFQRALGSVDQDPPAALTAACAILESFCRVYIEDTDGLVLPPKQDLGSLWAIVRKDLQIDAGGVVGDDIRRILGGLATVVDGIGALRTHAGSAHGKGRSPFPVLARHARLAVHAAHTLVTYLIERWEGRARPVSSGALAAEPRN
jgi:hypothetical protein